MTYSVLTYVGALALTATLLTSCQDEVNQPTATNTVRLAITLSGPSERPTPNNSAATGAFTGVLDTTTRVLSYTVTYTGLNSVMGHLHRMTPNTTDFTGPVERPFASLTSPIIGTTTLLRKSWVDSMLNGFYQANLPTTQYPAGEIRGTINPVAPIPVKFSAVMNGANEKPTPVASAATGMFTGSLDRTTKTLSYTVTYSGLTPTMGHLHRINAANGRGPVEIPFPSLATPIIATTVLPTRDRVDSLINDFYYSNLHTAMYLAGEIRGDCGWVPTPRLQPSAAQFSVDF